MDAIALFVKSDMYIAFLRLISYSLYVLADKSTRIPVVDICELLYRPRYVDLSVA